jgi:hypothetical protein
MNERGLHAVLGTGPLGLAVARHPARRRGGRLQVGKRGEKR